MTVSSTSQLVLASKSTINHTVTPATHTIQYKKHSSHKIHQYGHVQGNPWQITGTKSTNSTTSHQTSVLHYPPPSKKKQTEEEIEEELNRRKYSNNYYYPLTTIRDGFNYASNMADQQKTASSSISKLVQATKKPEVIQIVDNDEIEQNEDNDIEDICRGT
jgi:hypothetical protein